MMQYDHELEQLIIQLEQERSEKTRLNSLMPTLSKEATDNLYVK